MPEESLKTPRHDMPSRPKSRGQHEPVDPKRKSASVYYWSYAAHGQHIEAEGARYRGRSCMRFCVCDCRAARVRFAWAADPVGPVEGAIGYRRPYMIALGPLSAAWGFSMYIRCSDAKIRRWLVGVAALVAFWMLVVLLKYPIRGDLATALLWYCYYIPMTAIPTLCVLCAMRAASLDEVAWVRCVRRVIGGDIGVRRVRRAYEQRAPFHIRL